MDIKQQIQKDLRYTYGVGNPKKYLVIHQTANTRIGANAKAHADLQSRLGVDYSWHWQVDDKEAIQSYLHEVRCWHIGDGRGEGNLTSIGIEICINQDGNYIKSVTNGTKLAAKILFDENIPIERMVQHNYFKSKKHPKGKNCPAEIRAGKEGIDWNKFVEMVKKELEILKKPKATIKSTTDYNGFKKKGSHLVYFRKSGTQAFEWQFIKGSWYYFRKNTGTMVTGFQFIGGRWRYFGKDGQFIGDAEIINKKSPLNG